MTHSVLHKYFKTKKLEDYRYDFFFSCCHINLLLPHVICGRYLMTKKISSAIYFSKKLLKFIGDIYLVLVAIVQSEEKGIKRQRKVSNGTY